MMDMWVTNHIMKDYLFLTRIREIELQEKKEKRIFCLHNMEHDLAVARLMYIINLEENLKFPADVIYSTALLHDIGRYYIPSSREDAPDTENKDTKKFPCRGDSRIHENAENLPVIDHGKTQAESGKASSHVEVFLNREISSYAEVSHNRGISSPAATSFHRGASSSAAASFHRGASSSAEGSSHGEVGAVLAEMILEKYAAQYHFEKGEVISEEGSARCHTQDDGNSDENGYDPALEYAFFHYMKEILHAIRFHGIKPDENTPVLTKLLYEADKKSRACFACEVRHLCNWPDKNRDFNMEIFR